jgi:protein tyrosine phosphatase (PTP) superfamily phosphohydrolase (DUF442 family)
MLSTRPIAYGGLGPPVRPGRVWGPRLGVLLLALSTLGLEGCSSLSCGRSPCESHCSWLQNNFLTRRFRRDVVVSGGCPSGGCGAEPVLGAPVVTAPLVTTPGTVISPGASATPLPAPADESPMKLEPVPPAGESTAPTDKTGSNSLNRKTLYETQKPSGGMSTSRREASSPVGSSDRPVRSARPDDPLINLPPLSAIAQPAEDVTPPVPPAAEALVERSKPAPSVPRVALAPVAAAELPPRSAPRPLSLAEGIARFKVVEPQLAGGSLPTAPGWSFLAEKGYRTVLDLRPRAEVRTGDDAAAHHVGLRYVVLPVTPETLDAQLLKQFEEEIELAGNRPLFFFDTDGSRAAVLWYLHLILAGNQDEASAAKEVEELGPKDAKLWLAATTYLNERKQADAPGKAPEPVPAPVPAPAVPVPQAAILSAPEAPATSSDPTSWRPFAAMALTALSVPLAFASRSALSYVAGSVSRLASLPAPGRSPRALPPSSDA